MPKDISDFEVLLEMMKTNDKEIRCSNTLVEAKTVPQGGLLTFGVDRESLIDVTTSGDHICVAYVIKQSAFEEAKKRIKYAR